MLHGKTVAAIIVAAGSSRRMGFDKLFFEIDGVPVLGKSLAAFDAHPLIDELVVVAGQNAERVQPLLAAVQKPHRLVTGGAQRSDSVANGLAATDAAYVAIHDAARPFVSEAIITQALETAYSTGAAAPAVPVKDTVKIADAKGSVRSTPPRSSLFAVQTPQCFFAQTYRTILANGHAGEVTDDCSVFENAGHTVTLTQGSYANCKITTQEDLLPYLQPKKEAPMRIGHGYDVHRLTKNRKLVLGGVEIPYEKGLLGHSDADVLTHAVMDALLGAAALGDIGKHFPDSDETYRGADSIALLRHVGALLREHGYALQNLDATLLCQAPKLAPHIPTMRENLARALGVAVDGVSVKATTEEGLGFTGEGAGIAAHCVCLLAEVSS